jgi:hypothetical protein
MMKSLNKVFLPILLMGLFLAACAANEPPIDTPVPLQPTNSPTPNFSPQQEIVAYWKRGAHSKVSPDATLLTNSCASCHSPLDWDAALQAESPPDCLAASAYREYPLPENESGKMGDHAGDWGAIGCQVCHRPTEDNQYGPDLAFWNQATGSYEDVENSKALCEKCHRRMEDIDLSIDLGQGFHRSLTCVQCHEPHRLNASCANSQCHSGVSEELDIIKDLIVTPGHETVSPHNCGGSQCHTVATQVVEENRLTHIGVQHGNLTCSACHDATGMEVGPIGQSATWTTWRSADLNGEAGHFPHFSHDVQRQVDCQRCHFSDNPWSLPLLKDDSVP